MSVDPLETRFIARNWREYLTETVENLEVLAWVWRELTGPESKRLGKKVVIAGFLKTLFAIGQAWPLIRVFDGLVSRDVRAIVLNLGLVAAAWLLHQFFQYLWMAYRETMIGHNITRRDERLTELFFEKSLGQHQAESGNLSVGAMEKGKTKVDNLQEMLLFSGLSAVLDLLVVFIFIWVLSPVAGLMMALLLTLLVVSALFLNRRCIEVCTPIEIDFSRLNRERHTRWQHIERVKSTGMERQELERLTMWSRDIFRRDLAFWLDYFITRVNLRGLVEKITLLTITCYGVARVWQGDWTVGMLYPLFSWCAMFANNLWQLSAIEHQINWAMPSVKQMMTALKLEPAIKDKPEAMEYPADASPRIEFISVGHTYAAGTLEDEKSSKPTKPVLTNVCFTIEPGEKVALLGASGAGKTTLERLIQRHMDPDRGTILVDGHDLRDYTLTSWIAALGYIPQHAQIFDGTIRYNLLYGLTEEERKNVTGEMLWDMMRKLHIDFGERLTDGLETKVGQNGIRLSGGEAQRLIIGAAAMRRPRFMIIDEATSHLDSTTEKGVQKGLREVLTEDVGALIIAHRLSTVRDICSKFIVLKSSDQVLNGDPQIEAISASFEELYLISPTFRQLVRDQELSFNIKKAQLVNDLSYTEN